MGTDKGEENRETCTAQYDCLSKIPQDLLYTNVREF